MQGGYGGIEPILALNDPYFAPSELSPHGEHWLITTNVVYAWTLVGYNHPWEVDHTNPNRTIAIIDTGIDMDHPEFGGDGVLPSKLHPASATIVEGGAPVHPSLCPCIPSFYEPPDPENGPTDVEDTLWLASPGSEPHGTIEAGLAGAYAQNGQGVAGVCWDCSLLVLRLATYSFPSGEPCHGCSASAQSVAACIRYSAGWNPGQSYDDDSEWSPVRARVMSLATEGISGYNHDWQFCDPGNVLNRAIDLAHARGCIIVAIIGNWTNDCWDLGPDPGPEDPTCTPQNGFLGMECNLPLAWHAKTISVGGACRTGSAWHCHSRINPLTTTLGGCAELHYLNPPSMGESQYSAWWLPSRT
ncbi:MAG: hypothetical protein Kow0022_12370 [Phycisphaerales bacterium]